MMIPAMITDLKELRVHLEEHIDTLTRGYNDAVARVGYLHDRVDVQDKLILELKSEIARLKEKRK